MKSVIYRAVVLLVGLTASLTTSRASLLQTGLTLPPPGGAYTLPVHCIAPACLVDASFYNFSITNENFGGGNEDVTATAQFSAQVFSNAGGSPGLSLGSISAPGTVNITYFGRTTGALTGTFTAQLTDFLFAGTFNGHSFEFRQNPAMDSLGETTVTQISLAPLY
jgi:hypothetical protein